MAIVAGGRHRGSNSGRGLETEDKRRWVSRVGVEAPNADRIAFSPAAADVIAEIASNAKCIPPAACDFRDLSISALADRNR